MSDTPKFWWTPAMRRAWAERQEAARRRENERRENERRRSQAPQETVQSSDDGFLMGLVTGVPIPATPMGAAGAVIHNTHISLSPSSYDSGSSPSSYDSGSSSSSYDSGSSSSSSFD